MLENRQCFPYRRTTDAQFRREPLFEERLTGLHGSVEDRLLDGCVRNLSIARSALPGNSR